MPTANFYFLEKTKTSDLQILVPELNANLAEKLSCGDIKLSTDEISIRFIPVKGGKMIGDIELEITAHAFPERVKKQDEICLEVASYLKEKLPFLGEVKVWLKLSELGHSWK